MKTQNPDRVHFRGRDTVSKRAVAMTFPPVLLAVTYPVFHLAKAALGDVDGGHRAWFAGMAFYWVVWGGVFSLWVLGSKRARELIAPRKPEWNMVGHVAFIVVMAAGVRFLVPGMAYDLPTTAAVVFLTVSTFANGLFEELLWRGIYLDVFPNNTWLRVVVPSIWFGLWHLIPGSISADGAHIAMIIGPFFMGLYLAYMAKKADSLWWPMLAHTIGGLVMIS